MEVNPQSSDMVPETREAVYKPQVKENLKNRGRLSSSYFDIVDWDSTGWAMDISPDMYQMWHSKKVNWLYTVLKITNKWGLCKK